MTLVSEDRVDLLEEKIRTKIDTMTGFSDVEGKSRALEKVSKQLPQGRSSFLSSNGLVASKSRVYLVARGPVLCSHALTHYFLRYLVTQ